PTASPWFPPSWTAASSHEEEGPAGAHRARGAGGGPLSRPHAFAVAHHGRLGRARGSAAGARRRRRGRADPDPGGRLGAGRLRPPGDAAVAWLPRPGPPPDPA